MAEPGALFTPAELEALARTPAGQVADALAEGPARAGAVVDALERRFRTGLRGSARWEAGSVAALREAGAGDDDLQRLATERAWLVGALNGVAPADLAVPGGRHGDEVAALAGTGGTAAALARWGELEGSYRRLRDAHRDATALLWSALHELAGREALERCLRALAEPTLMRWMDHDVTLGPADRLRGWSAVLTANFARIAIAELPDRFVVTQDPCGTCTRQVLDGRTGPPLSLALVEPFASDLLGPEALPVYRSHVGLMHWLMPLERIGVPWPAIRCPAGAGTGPCRIELAKDPLAPLAPLPA